MRFWLILAGHLGMTLAECRRRVGAQEFALWQALHSIDPIGEEREDWRNARLVQAIHASNPFRKPGSRPPSVRECKIDFAPQASDPADNYLALESAVKGFNARMRKAKQRKPKAVAAVR